MTLDSTINGFAYYNSDEEETERNPKSDPLVDTHTSDRKKRKVTDTGTTNGNHPQKILINRTLPITTPPIEPPIAYVAASDIGTTHARHTIASKVIVTDAACSGARVFQDPADINRKDTEGKITWESNTSRRSPRLTSQVLIGGGTTVSPTRTRIQDISSTKGPTGSVEVRNVQILNTSINRNSTKNEDPTPTFSNVIGRKISDASSADIHLRCRVNFTHDAVVTKIPNFMNLGLSDVHTLDEIGSFSIPATIIGNPTNGSNWLPSDHLIGEVTEARIIRTSSEQKYSPKTDF